MSHMEADNKSPLSIKLLLMIYNHGLFLNARCSDLAIIKFCLKPTEDDQALSSNKALSPIKLPSVI